MAETAKRLSKSTQQRLTEEWDELLKKEKVPHKLRKKLIKAFLELRRSPSPEINISNIVTCLKFHGVNNISESTQIAFGESLTLKPTKKKSKRRSDQRLPIKLPLQLPQSY